MKNEEYEILDKIETLSQFEKKLGFVYAESLIEKKFERINRKIRLDYFDKWINVYKTRIAEITIKESKELQNTLLFYVIVISIIFYPIRIFVILLIWAIKILRNS